jgi:hypothetical protein
MTYLNSIRENIQLVRLIRFVLSQKGVSFRPRRDGTDEPKPN